MVVPLTNLTRKDMRWIWTSECQEAFEKVKHVLTNAPVLAPPELGRPFEVVSDAPGVGLGAVILQDGRPVAFESRKLSPAEQNYIVTEQEMLGVIHALKTWRCYLEGSDFTVVTDHCPSTFFDTQANLSRRQARWSEFLSRFKFDWEYRPGRTNHCRSLESKSLTVSLAVLYEGEGTSRGKRAADLDPPWRQRACIFN
jgi:hypothetical protein